MEPWVELCPFAERLVSDKLGESIWPSIWVVVLAGLSFGVAVLSRGGRPGGGKSSSGWRGFCRMLRFLEWDSCVEFLCSPSGSSSSFPSVTNLVVAKVLGSVQLWTKRSWWSDGEICDELEFLEWDG